VHRYDSPTLSAWQAVATPSIAQRVGEAFGAAPPELRVKVLEHLLRPLGLLSVAAVAKGAFAKIRFRNGWPDMRIRADDVVGVTVADVVSLVDHVLQVDERVVIDLAALLQDWPRVRELEAVAMLVQLLRQGSHQEFRRGGAKGAEPVWH
jgi:hypothetical protein